MLDFNVILTREQIQNKVKEIANQIDFDFDGKEIYALVFSRKSFIFASDLFREMKADLHIDFSFKLDDINTDSFNFEDILSFSPFGKSILIVENLIYEGNNIFELKNIIENCGATEVKTCVFIDSRSLEQKKDDKLKFDYVGFSSHDLKLVGYGVDIKQRYGNLPFFVESDI